MIIRKLVHLLIYKLEHFIVRVIELYIRLTLIDEVEMLLQKRQNLLILPELESIKEHQEVVEDELKVHQPQPKQNVNIG
jgi:hypothetical protein